MSFLSLSALLLILRLLYLTVTVGSVADVFGNEEIIINSFARAFPHLMFAPFLGMMRTHLLRTALRSRILAWNNNRSYSQQHMRLSTTISGTTLGTASAGAGDSSIVVGKLRYPSRVRITEVSARDGIKSEKTFIPTAKKVEMINRLSETGIYLIPSFVSFFC
jgi:hypothetical protein